MINKELAAFIESGVSILAAGRDARLVPECARAVGARVEKRGTELTVFLPVATSATLLADLRDNERIAVIFTHTDHRSVQFKGRVVSVRDADAEDRRVIERYRPAIAEAWGFFGLPLQFTMRLNHWPCHAVRMRVESTFVQTPGPAAGELMCSSATLRAP
jgi:hypothetical protein